MKTNRDVLTHKFPYRWTLKNANFSKDKGEVFSCFSCGGGFYYIPSLLS